MGIGLPEPAAKPDAVPPEARAPLIARLPAGRGIGTLAERSLHAALKEHCAEPGDAFEVDLDGYVIDIVRGLPGAPECIEIETGSLHKIRPKLAALLDRYPVEIVYPVALERTIVRVDADGAIVSRRRSPRHGAPCDVFPELVSLVSLVTHPHLTLRVLLVRDEVVWVDDRRGSWRRGRWSVHDRRLLAVEDEVLLATPADFAALLPGGLPGVFGSDDLATAIGRPRRVGQQMAYCLRALSVVAIAGKRGRATMYARTLP